MEYPESYAFNRYYTIEIADPLVSCRHQLSYATALQNIPCLIASLWFVMGHSGLKLAPQHFYSVLKLIIES